MTFLGEFFGDGEHWDFGKKMAAIEIDIHA